jgi:fructose-1,6-bisphosphatase I
LKKPEGKLRLLYESAPLAFLMEQAGGRASTGTQNLLDVVPQALHARTPLIIGSKEDVALVESFIQDRGRQSQEGLQVSLG